MKKTFAFVLAIILLCPVALADTLREQVNAPMEHKGTYSSPSGRSHIYVDAQVIVPEAETIPIYQAFARVPDEMEFKLLADLAFGAGGYTLERGKTDASNPAGVTYAEGDPAETAKGFHMYFISTDLRSASLLHQQEDFSCVQAYYGIWDYAKNTYAFPRLVYFAHGGNFGKNLPPEADARAAADAVVSQVFPDFQFWGSADKKNLNHLGERIGQGDAVRRHLGGHGLRDRAGDGNGLRSISGPAVPVLCPHDDRHPLFPGRYDAEPDAVGEWRNVVFDYCVGFHACSASSFPETRCAKICLKGWFSVGARGRHF